MFQYPHIHLQVTVVYQSNPIMRISRRKSPWNIFYAWMVQLQLISLVESHKPTHSQLLSTIKHIHHVEVHSLDQNDYEIPIGTECILHSLIFELIDVDYTWATSTTKYSILQNHLPLPNSSGKHMNYPKRVNATHIYLQLS